LAKFYWKSVVSTALLVVIAMLGLNLVKGAEIPMSQRKFLIVPWITVAFYLIINEKTTIRESWNWYHWLMLVPALILSVLIVSLI